MHGVVKLIIYWHRYSDFAVWPMHCVSHYPVSELGSTTTVPSANVPCDGFWAPALTLSWYTWRNVASCFYPSGKGEGGR